jgi:2Fe-2S ferredoxin
MIRITFTDADGVRYERAAEVGTSLMHLAVQSGVPGILAECGGACACATCHVQIDPEWLAASGPVAEMEGEMLDYAVGRGVGSRLSCQIELTAAMDGLTVRIPKTQK